MRAIAAALASLAVVTLVGACSDLKSASPTSSDAERDAETGETDDDDLPPANDADADAATTDPRPRADAGTAAACGTCKSFEACDETSAGATCKPATIVWEVDGIVVTKLATYEAFYTASSSTYSLFFNHYGRNVQISFSGETTGTLTQCPGGGSASFGLITPHHIGQQLVEARCPARPLEEPQLRLVRGALERRRGHGS